MGPNLTRTLTLAVAIAAAACCPAAAGAQTAVLLAAGDVAGCAVDGDEQTAALLDGQPGTIAMLGDAAYPNGTAAEFAACYDPSWGRHKERTRPTPGNHEYRQSGASAYFDYFGAAAGTPGEGWYSYELGAWHVISLNSNCVFVGCDPGSPQEQWLRADLAAHPAACTLAYWHHPRFSSGRPVQLEDTEPLMAALYEGGAELVLAGHDHIYERFAPQTPIGDASPAYGIREFVVGTGGFSHSRVQAVLQPNSQAQDAGSFGVLRLTLSPTGYSWSFLPVPGATFFDSGSGTCHAPPPDTTPPTVRLTLPAPDAADVVVRGLQIVAADAFDPPGFASRVDFLVDQTVVASDTTRPYAVQWDTTASPDGVRRLKVRAVDAWGNSSSMSTTIVIDNERPQTTITQGPKGTLRVRSPEFHFTSEPGAGFRCSLDGARPKPCRSPAKFRRLRDGRHVFRVRAKDAAGRIDKTPARRSWRIDTKAPDTAITRARLGRSSPARAAFAFAASERARFQCSLDGSAWTYCASPARYAKLTPGRHVFAVRAVDAAGNPDSTPARRRWRVSVSGRGE